MALIDSTYSPIGISQATLNEMRCQLQAMARQLAGLGDLAEAKKVLTEAITPRPTGKSGRRWRRAQARKNRTWTN